VTVTRQLGLADLVWALVDGGVDVSRLRAADALVAALSTPPRLAGSDEEATAPRELPAGVSSGQPLAIRGRLHELAAQWREVRDGAAIALAFPSSTDESARSAAS
jgi:hypothetical protein